MQLPFAIIPLVHFTGDRRRMGEFATRPWLDWTARVVAGAVIILNVGWAAAKLLPWADTPLLDLLLLGVFAGLLPLLGYLLATPWLERSRAVSPWFRPETTSERPSASAFLEHVDGDAEQHLSEARFAAFMEHLRGIAMIKDPEGRYVYFNPACSTLLGIAVEDALYKTDDELWPADLAAIYRKNDQKVLRERKPFEGIEPMLQGGETRPWLMYKFPIVDGETGQVFLGAVGVDIAGREQLEERVLQSRKFEVIGRIAGGVAHHFNNLLTVITGYSRMVLDELAPSDRSRERLQEVLHAADSAAALTSQLLSFSRRQMLQFRDVDLNQVVRDFEPALRASLGDGVRLSFELTANLARVNADARHIQRVVEALVFNARDAMKETGGRVTIVTANVQSGRVPCVKLSIHDEGAGMDELTKQRLFEPFFTTKRVGEGAGLGLSSVYGIVKQHGGEITVESQPGIGTSFAIFLPVLTPGGPELRARIVE
jgi:PAS domain S-box-containing protein